MAGDWIKVRKNLLTDPRVVRISSALHADRLRTVGALVAAWCLLDEHTEDGRLDGYSADAFDDICGVPGLAHAMEAVGWLTITPQGIEAPRFTEHNGATARRRAQESVRKVSARAAQNVRKTSASDADKKRPREEKSKSIQEPPIVPLGDSEPNGKKFTRPTVADVLGYCQERGISIDAERFVDHYTANGWRIGKAPMKDWRAAVRNWARERKQRDGSTDKHDDYQALRD